MSTVKPAAKDIPDGYNVQKVRYVRKNGEEVIKYYLMKKPPKKTNRALRGSKAVLDKKEKLIFLKELKKKIIDEEDNDVYQKIMDVFYDTKKDTPPTSVEEDEPVSEWRKTDEPDTDDE